MVRKLILQSHLTLGDVVMLTAAVRDLHRLYPGQFHTDVRTGSPELWLHNPHLVPLDPFDPDVQTLGCNTPLIDRSARFPGHYLFAFADFLNQRLGLRLEPTEFRGDIHLSDEECSGPDAFQHLTGKRIPYWIVSAGGRYDITIKWWPTERYQRVIDHFRGRLQFVQVGKAGDHHPPLRGVLDLRGRTSLRQLLRVIHHADGVLCGVTAHMHLAAAVPRPEGVSGLRPCVVVAGGREPPSWEAYPGHQFLHNVGALPCCQTGGCWKSRAQPLGDGAEEDRPSNRCTQVVDALPRCMDLIRPEDVIRAIECYIQGGSVRTLTRMQWRLATKATRAAGTGGFDDLPLNLSSARLALEGFLTRAPAQPQGQSGRGIILCAGGARYFVNAWVGIRALRRLGCTLPIQVWHTGRHELDSPMARLLAPLDTTCVDASRLQRQFPARRLQGWPLKPYALTYSTFREVLMLDADNVPIRDPSFLFDCAPYRETGALFWPDRGRSRDANPVWRICGLTHRDEPEFESGQLVVDKARCWPALRLALWFNEHADFFYQHLHGDKDTFRLAFHRLDTPFHVVPHPPVDFPGGMYQHDLEGRRLFQHRNACKWTLMPHNPEFEGFIGHADCLADLEELRRRWDGRMRWCRTRFATPRRLPRHPRTDPTFAAWMITCPERDAIRQTTLDSLAASDWPDLPLHILHDHGTAKHREARVQRICHQVLQALQEFLHGTADHCLLLEDDLLFNCHLRHNLLSWPLLQQRQLTLAGLYNPALHETAFDLPNRAIVVLPENAYGTQALLLSRAAATHAVAGWQSRTQPADHRLARLVGELSQPLYWHAPSLVQHQLQPSTWGGFPHQAIDFDPSWRAEQPQTAPSRRHGTHAEPPPTEHPVDLPRSDR